MSREHVAGAPLISMETRQELSEKHLLDFRSHKRDILQGHPSGGNPADNVPADDVLWTIRDVVDEPFVAVLDEADDLPYTDALESLTGIDGLALIVITHDEDTWLAQAPDDARRRFTRASGHQLQLDCYGVNELADILGARASRGLIPNCVTREQLETIADEVAGVARAGIQSLRAAAELASEREHSVIEDTDVEDSFERARHRIREMNLRSLTFHHHVLYALIHEVEEISAGELHERYEMVSDELYRGHHHTPLSQRSRRNKLQKLRDYDLIDCEGEHRHRRYSVIDERVTTSIGLGEAAGKIRRE